MRILTDSVLQRENKRTWAPGLQVLRHCASEAKAAAAAALALEVLGRGDQVMSWPTATNPMDNPYCSCKQHVFGQPRRPGHGLQLRSLWRIPTADVSSHGRGDQVVVCTCYRSSAIEIQRRAPPPARPQFCCTPPPSLRQASQYGWRGGVSEMTVSPRL